MRQVHRLGRIREGRPAAPVRIVHLGLGNFTRAHQAWYTDQAPDHDRWGIAAFSGHTDQSHRSRVVDALSAQDGLYTLIERDAEADRFTVISSISQVLPGSSHREFCRLLADPKVAVVTSTITEAGYRRGADGRLNTTDPAVQTDIDLLRNDPAATPATAPARLAAGLASRRDAAAGPVTMLPCDNIASNGAALRTVVTDLSETIDPELAAWITDPENVDWATSMVDRITPATTDADLPAVLQECGYVDEAPVVTEPFAEWVITGVFPAGRPDWQSTGAKIVDDVTPYEQRKLWLLNGAHSLLAYLGPTYSCATVAQAIEQPDCYAAVQDWWEAASRHLDIDTTDYREALIRRFANPRIAHQLTQIGRDGSVKLPQRILPVIRAERAERRNCTAGALAVAAWVQYLRDHGGPISDPAADRLRELAAGDAVEAAIRVIGFLDSELASDTAFTRQVAVDLDRLAVIHRAS